MTRILVADDHIIVRQGIKQILSDMPDMTVTDEAGSAQQVFDEVSKNAYEVVLLDISLHDRNGMDILKELKSIKPSLPVLILSIHPEEQYALRAFRAGACGYLNKQCAPQELIVAIRKVALGGKYISPSLTEKLASDLEVGRKNHFTSRFPTVSYRLCACSLPEKQPSR